MTNKNTYQERQEKAAIEAERKAKEERAAKLLSIFRETTNHLSQENEETLLAEVFACLDLPFVKGEKVPVVGSGEVFPEVPGDV